MLYEWYVTSVCALVTVYFLFFRDTLEEKKRDHLHDLHLRDWWAGRWYEIAAVQRGVDQYFRSSTNNSLCFIRLPDGSMDFTANSFAQSFLYRSRSRRFQSGTARFAGNDTIVWELNVGMFTVSFRYIVRYKSPDGQWCLLSPKSNKDKSILLFCRQPHMRPDILRHAVRVIKGFGFSLEQLIPTSQLDPYEDVFMLSTIRRYGVLSIEMSHDVNAPIDNHLLSPFIFRGDFSKEYCSRVFEKFWQGCVRGDLTFVYDFVQREPLWVDARDLDLWSALHIACHNGHIDLVYYLLQSGANVNARNNKMETPLHVAISGYLRHIKERIQWQRERKSIFDLMGGDNKYSHKPHSLYFFEKTIEMLLKYGAKVNMVQHSKLTPRMMLQRGLRKDATLLYWVDERGDLGNPVRTEVVRSFRNVSASLFYGQAVTIRFPALNNRVIRHMLLGFVLAWRYIYKILAATYQSLYALVLGVQLLVVVFFYWVILRGLGYVGIQILYRTPDERADAFARFRAECIYLIVLTMNNPTIHKIAQIISCRPDLVDRNIAVRVQSLRNNVPPMSQKELDEELRKVFGADRSHIFEEFDVTPMASGTIAQVHRAKLANGGPWVAVKVVRNSISETLERVLQLVSLILSLRFFKDRSLLERTRRIYALILCQGDMLLESESIKAMQRCCDQNKGDIWRIPRIPRVNTLFTSRNVLTMELIENQVPCTRFEECGIPGPILALRLGHFHIRSVFMDGIFHCDLHPGNIFFDKANKGRMTIVDFGLVGEINEPDRINLVAFFLAALSGEIEIAMHIFRTHFIENSEQTFVNEEIVESFNKEMGPIIRHHFLESDTWDVSKLMEDFDHIYRKYGVRGTSAWASLELSLLTLQGTLMMLSPSRDVRTLFEQFITSNFKAMLASISASQFYDQLYHKVMEKYSFGALLVSAQARKPQM